MQTDLTPSRKANETFDAYKTRRSQGNAEVKAHARGSYVYSFEDTANVRYDPVTKLTHGIPYQNPDNR